MDEIETGEAKEKTGEYYESAKEKTVELYESAKD